VPLDHLNAKMRGGLARQCRGLQGAAIVRIVEDDHPAEFRKNFFQDLKPLGRKIRGRVLYARQSAVWLAKALHQSALHRVGSDRENDRNSRGGILYHCRCGRGNGINQIDSVPLKTLGCLLNDLQVTFGIADFNDDMFSLCVSLLPQSKPQPAHYRFIRSALVDHSDVKHLGLLPLSHSPS
jgi:hypothetical protein